MAARSVEEDVLIDLWESIIEILRHNLETFAANAISAHFVTEQAVDEILTAQGGHAAKVRQIMSSVKTIITQGTQSQITGRFNQFVQLLRNLTLDDLAQRLVDDLSKCTLSVDFSDRSLSTVLVST